MTDYAKQTWVDGEAGNTPISAARLNHIEQGIHGLQNLPFYLFTDEATPLNVLSVEATGSRTELALHDALGGRVLIRTDEGFYYQLPDGSYLSMQTGGIDLADVTNSQSATLYPTAGFAQTDSANNGGEFGSGAMLLRVANEPRLVYEQSSGLTLYDADGIIRVNIRDDGAAAFQALDADLITYAEIGESFSSIGVPDGSGALAGRVKVEATRTDMEHYDGSNLLLSHVKLYESTGGALEIAAFNSDGSYRGDLAITSTATALEGFDGTGNYRGSLWFGEPGSSELSFNNADQTLRVNLADNGEGLTLCDDSGNGRVYLSEAGGLSVLTAMGQSVFIGPNGGGSAELNMGDGAAQNRVSLMADGSGLTLYDSAGNTRVTVVDDLADGGSLLTLLDDSDVAYFFAQAVTSLGGVVQVNDTIGAQRVAMMPGVVFLKDADSFTRVNIADDGSGLTLNDAAGNIALSLVDNFGISLYDPDFTIQAAQLIYSDGLLLLDSTDTTRVQLGGWYGTGLRLCDGLLDRVTLKDDGTGLTLYDADGITRATFSEQGGIAFNSSSGTPVVVVASDEQGFKINDQISEQTVAHLFHSGIVGELDLLLADGATLQVVVSNDAAGGAVTLYDDAGADPQVLDHDTLALLLALLI